MIKKRITIIKSINSLLFLFLFQSKAIFGENLNTSKQFCFPTVKQNVLSDPGKTLSPFFMSLKELEETTDSAYTVSIIHLGDSHIQADFQTSRLRDHFQNHFGNAGRGLIAPLKMAATNEPRNYRIASFQEWEYTRCIKPGTVPFGLTGLVLRNTDESCKIKIETLDRYDFEKWHFRDVTVYCNANQCSVSISNTDSSNYIREISGDHMQRFILNESTPELEFNIRAAGKPDNRIYGFNLKNGKNGILYHAIGINGAHYSNYAEEELFAEQLSTLEASLIIISLGTNEAYSRAFNPQSVYKKIDQTINTIRKYAPNAIFLLTTPAETWLGYRTKKRRPHPNVAIVSKTIVEYAQKNRLAYWDLFSITGGKGSAFTWSKHKLLARDGIHFSKEGYECIGELLFEAFYRAYREQIESVKTKGEKNV